MIFPSNPSGPAPKPLAPGPAQVSSDLNLLAGGRPLRAWSAAQLHAVQAHFLALSRQWHRAWALPEAPLPAANPNPARTGNASPCPLRGDAAATDYQPLPCPCPWAFDPIDTPSAAWVSALNRGVIAPSQATLPIQRIHAGLFGGTEATAAVHHGQPSVAQELAWAAWADWWARLSISLGTQVSASDASACATSGWWSGRLQVHLPWCGGRLVLELSPEQVLEVLAIQPDDPDTAARSVPAVATPNRPKVPLSAALQAHPIPLRATLTGVDLTLGQLQSLAIGDVVPLLHPLSRPVSLELADQTVLCRGWLGQQAGQVVLELTTETTAA